MKQDKHTYMSDRHESHRQSAGDVHTLASLH